MVYLRREFDPSPLTSDIVKGVTPGDKIDTRQLKRHVRERYPPDAPLRLIVETLPDQMSPEGFGSVAQAIIRALDANRD